MPEPILYPEVLAELRLLLDHGDMEFISDDLLNEAWGDYSGDLCASFLIADQTTIGGFVAYLLRNHYKPRA